MRALIIRDSLRSNYEKENYREYHEPGLYTAVVNSNALVEMPHRFFDVVIIDIMEYTIKKGDFSFLAGLKNLDYRAALAMATSCATLEAAKPKILSMGVHVVMERPTSNASFFEKLDELLQANPRPDDQTTE